MNDELSNDKYEVVKWFPNPMYDKKDEYRVENELGEVEYVKNGVNYSESCFKHPESCFVVSFVDWNAHENWWEVREVGTRPFEMNENDFISWIKIMRLIAKSEVLPKPKDDEVD